MKSVKSIVALLLAVLLTLSFAGCHGANEIAVTYGDVEFTSGMYAMALFNADGEARTRVDEEHTHAEGEEHVDGEELDYFAQQIDGKSFEQWVKDTAMQNLAAQAAYRILCKEKGITLSEEVLADVESYADYYYSYYESVLVLNGIGEKSYKELMIGDAYSDEYFKALYGEGGEKEVSSEELKKLYDESYRTAIVLTGDYSSLEEAAKSELKTKLEGYKTRLDKNESHLDIYNEYNALSGDDAVSEEKDIMALLADGEVDTNYGFAQWDKVKDLKAGETVIVDDIDASAYYLVKIVDTSADETYFEELKETLLWTLKQEEYDAFIEEYIKNLSPKVNKYAVNAFKVKNIKYE